MTVRISKSERRSIIADFMDRNGGRYDPRAFVEEVQRTNGQHPAWTWFTWDDDKAAADHRIWQARVFAQDIVVKFSVEQIKRGKVVIVAAEIPVFVSPVEGRAKGGGYIQIDPDSPAQMASFCAEAARSLQVWIRRYSGAVAYAGGSISGSKKLAGLLENALVSKVTDAA